MCRGPCCRNTPFLDVCLWSGNGEEGWRINNKQQAQVNIDLEPGFLALVAMCKQCYLGGWYALQKL